MQTRLRFDNDVRFDLSEQAVTAFAGYAAPSGWSFRGSIGALLDGSLERTAMPDEHDMSPGLVVAVGVARQWTSANRLWFITGSAGLSVAAAKTHEAGAADDPSFVAGDARVGAIAGRTFGKIVSPYVLARGFGGPVWWTVDNASTTGTDTHHYQLGAGLSVATSVGLTIVVDVSALGEQAASVGASWRL